MLWCTAFVFSQSGEMLEVEPPAEELQSIILETQPLSSSLPEDSVFAEGIGSFSGGDLPTSGDTLLHVPETGDMLESGGVYPPENSLSTTPILSSVATITEIFPKDTTLLGEYVLLEFSSSYQGLVRISGLGTASAEKSFEISASAGMRIVITDMPEKITAAGVTVVPISSITLTDTGEPLQVFLGTGTDPVDKVLYQTSSSDKALYFGGETDAVGFRIFLLLDTPSVLGSSPPPSGTGTTTGTISGDEQSAGCSLVVENLVTSGQKYLAQISLSGATFCSTSQLSRHVGSLPYLRMGCSQEFLIDGGTYTTISVSTGSCIPVSIYTPSTSSVCASLQESVLIAGGVEMTEIHPGDTEQFPEYIELLFHQSFSGTVEIDGLGQGTASKELSLQASSGSYRIVSDQPAFFGHQPFVVGIHTISLTDGGESLTIRTQDGQVIDTYVYSGHDKTASLVVTATSGSSTGDESVLSGTSRLFTTEQAPTPGFEWSLVSYLFETTSDAEISSCGIDFQHGDPVFATNKINLQAMIDGTSLANSSATYACEWLLSGSDLGYSTGCNPGFIGYTASGVYPVTLRIWEGATPVCDIVQELNLPAKSTGTVGKTSGSGSTYYEDLYHKRKGRFEFLKRQVKSLGYTVAASGDLSGSPEAEIFSLPTGVVYLGDVLRIQGVIANPVGRDTEGELMEIENLTDDPILTDELILVRGKSTKKLPAGVSLPPHQKSLLKGDMGLTNKPTCISLRFRDIDETLSNFCYPQPQEGVLFTGGLVGIETEKDSQLLGLLKIELEDTQVCALYEGQQLLCTSLPFSLAEAKERKKSARKTTSLEKKVTTLQGKYDLRRGKYSEQSKKFRTKEATYVTRARSLRQEVQLQDQKKEIYRALFFLLKNELIWAGQPVWGTPLADIDALYRRLAAHQEDVSFRVGAVDLSPAAVQDRYAFLEEGKLPLHEVTIEEVMNYLQDRSSEQIDLFQQLVFDY